MTPLAHTIAIAGAPRKWVNAVLFNLSWLAILWTQSTAAAIAIAVVHLIVHFAVVGDLRREWTLIVGVTLFGAVVDQLLFYCGVLTLAGYPALAPLWLTCLWPVFATTLMHALAPLQHRPYLAAVIGAVGGALSYLAGVRLTEIEFSTAMWGPAVIGVLWAALCPLLLKVAAGSILTSRDPAECPGQSSVR